MTLDSPDGSRLRLSGVSFLNAQPILHGLLSGMGHDRLRLSLEQPAELSRQLFEGEVDAALAPVAPLATHGGLEIVPGVAIGCDGPVRSVLLVADAPFESLNEILLDSASRTSVVLARLILKDLRNGDEPKYCARPADEIVEGVKGATGGLLIGDPALEVEGRFSHVIDLGQAWKELTGLPFVFALWIARPGALSSADCALLRSSMEQGVTALSDIAGAWQRGHGGAALEHQRYLEESIRYELDGPALEGLAEFYRRAASAGLLPECELKFVHAGSGWCGVEPVVSEAVPPTGRLSLVQGLELYETATEEGPREPAGSPPSYRGVDSEIRRVSYSDSRAGQGATREGLVAEVLALVKSGVHRVRLSGRIEPRFQLEWFEHLFRSLLEIPGIELHGMTPDEIVAISRQEDLTLASVVQRLADAGLTLLYGGDAHVLTDRARSTVTPGGCSSREWLEVLRLAHRAGMKSVVTMTYGGGEALVDRVLHLIKLRDLQDETGGLLSLSLASVERVQGAEQDSLNNEGERLRSVAQAVLDNVSTVRLCKGHGGSQLLAGHIPNGHSADVAHMANAPRTTQLCPRLAR